MAIAHQSQHTSIQGTRRRIKDALAEASVAGQAASAVPDFTENSRVVLQRRYLSKDREGNVLEDAEGLFRRVAHNLSQADRYYGASEQQRKATEDEFFTLMRSLDFLPNSPTLMNAGRELQQLSACFVLPVEDSLDAIFSRVKQTALIHKSGGGTGFSFSRLRPEGDVVGSTGGVASGPVSFIRAFDTATDVVKQGGTRRGANMGILNVDHPDIVRFIRSKENGQQLVNFNISVAVTEEFMEKALAGQDYNLVNPRTGQVTGQLNAKEVFDLIADMAWKTGDPGIVFLDRINRDNPNPQLGRIESTNPCGEQPLLPYESCNLGSLNLARMVRYESDKVEMDWERLARAIRTAVHLLDNVIDMNEYPIQEIADMSRTTRRIGVGVMGFADLLLQLGIRYDSEEALAVGEECMRRIQEESYKASAELSRSRGTFPSWEGSIYNQPGGLGPMRNSAPITIAPTGTISIIAGASSGIEPLFALSYVRNVMDNTRLVEVHPYFEAVAKHEGFYSDELMQQLAEKGSLESLEVPPWVKEVFRVSHDINPEWHVRMQAAFQRHTDNSVSKTINFPHDATVADIANAYMLAYQTGCKGITVYRDGSKAGQVLSTGETGKHAEAETAVAVAAPVELYRTPRPRPTTVRGVTERVRTGHGNMYVTINFDDEGTPFEVFTTLGKAGGCDSAQLEAISRLVSLALRSGIDPRSLTEQLRGITCCPAWDNGVLVRSGPDAVALALERHLTQESAASALPVADAAVQLKLTPGPAPAMMPMKHGNGNGNGNGHSSSQAVTRKCPDCNGQMVFQEGCLMCMSCGWNKCE
ncbi:MAG: vitamin B12-dependent ribonucleotide reductase [SAR202 cluster bacterium]|nr:vitamin B12-dependent ribonucleotide reductase [SAR202 cluster bacterium]